MTAGQKLPSAPPRRTFFRMQFGFPAKTTSQADLWLWRRNLGLQGANGIWLLTFLFGYFASEYQRFVT